MLQEAKGMVEQFQASGAWGWLLSGLLWFLGGWDETVLALLVATGADFGLGTWRALRDHRYDGTVFRKRLFGKIFPVLILIGLAHMVDVTFCDKVPFFTQPFRGLVISLVTVTEFLSANRHLNALWGVRLIPAHVIEKLEAYKDSGGVR